MVKVDRKTWKANYFAKLHRYLGEYNKIIIISCDNVGSKQMQQVRMSLRGQAEMLFGKNTMMRKAISIYAEEHPIVAPLLEHVNGNIGFVFTNMDLIECREALTGNRVSAPAKAGGMAPIDVTIPAGNTGMGPEKTSFFQALAIPTKISRGTIEILNDVPLITAGNRVGASEAILLNMMGVSPFTYGLELTQVYDNGSCYSPEILDITDAVIIGKFMSGLANVAAVSMAIGYPNSASVPHYLAKGFKNVLAVAVATEIEFKEAEKIKAYLADPSAFAVAAPAAAAAPAGGAAAPAPVEEEEEEEEDMDFDLFG